MKTNEINNQVAVYVRPCVEVLPVSQDSLICESPGDDKIEGSGHDFTFDD